MSLTGALNIGRSALAVQQSALQAWGGEAANADTAQAAFVHRARMNALAAAGGWSAELEQPVAV